MTTWLPMKIVTTEQAILYLILKYWDNAGSITLEITRKEIQEYYLTGGHLRSFDWPFKLTWESLINLFTPEYSFGRN